MCGVGRQSLPDAQLRLKRFAHSRKQLDLRFLAVEAITPGRVLVDAAIPLYEPGKSRMTWSGEEVWGGAENPTLDALYRRFRQPLDECPALSAAPLAVRDWLGSYLWRTMIADPSVEGMAFEALAEDGLRPDQLELLRKCYRERMRPQISLQELSQIRSLLATRASREQG